jgi:hypothetical protein
MGLDRASRRHTPSLRHLSQQQQTAIRRLIAASKINCEFLAPDRWKVEGKQRIVAHGGCGGGLMDIAIRWNIDLLLITRFLLQPSLNSSQSRIIRASVRLAALADNADVAQSIYTRQDIGEEAWKYAAGKIFPLLLGPNVLSSIFRHHES